MSHAAIDLLSIPYLADEIFETVPKEDHSNETVEITKQRIDSFVKEPSVEPEETEQESINFKNTSMYISQRFEQKETKAILTVPKLPKSKKTFSSLQSWEGYVIDINHEYFTARITDLSGEHPDEEIEILLEDISDDDKKLVVCGAIFYWHVGYETENGTKKRSSIIRFRRMPRWTKSDFLKAKEFKTKLDQLF